MCERACKLLNIEFQFCRLIYYANRILVKQVENGYQHHYYLQILKFLNKFILLDFYFNSFRVSAV